MATNVTKENNILILDTDGSKTYHCGAWCSMRFDETSVYINDESKTNGINSVEYEILLTDFQGNGSPINTEEAIATFLSDKIG